MQRFSQRAEGCRVQSDRRSDLPFVRWCLVKVNAGVQVGAGILLTLGKWRRLSALLLIGSVLPTTWAGHRFWEHEDPEEREQQRMQFLKKLAMLGGLILELVDSEGAPSLGWRARRAASRAGGVFSSHAHSEHDGHYDEH